VPDRNWNIKDPDQRARKVAELDRYVAAAAALDLPINIGTELNKPGQRFVDDFDAAPMRPHVPLFLQGAQIMVGQTRLLRYADLSYTDAATAEEFPDRAARNAFFAAVGALPGLPEGTRECLAGATSAAAFAAMRDSVKANRWTV
jgi:hypothetical protein